MTAAGHWLVVREVISSTASGADVMSALPGLIRRLLDEEAWREFDLPGGGGAVRHETFASFITSAPPKGLGGRSAQLVALCGADERTRSRIQRLLRGEKVIAGEISAYAAARAKGWKPPRIQVTTPERTAAHLRKYMVPKDLAIVAKLITEN